AHACEGRSHLRKGVTSMAALKILIVEDNPMNMELATDLLEAAGYDICQAWNAEDALEVVKSDPPALILMDIGLPGMNGLDTTRVLKDDPSTNPIPVIALTAHAMVGDREKA